MKIVVTSVLVDDQEKALCFYTDVLGFVKKKDIPMGAARWLTVVSPDDPEGVELVMEPDGHPAARPFKRALVEDGIPFTSFGVKDVNAEYKRLVNAGVRFTQPPVDMGPVTTAVFDDICGNLIQVAQKKLSDRRPWEATMNGSAPALGALLLVVLAALAAPGSKTGDAPRQVTMLIPGLEGRLDFG